MLKILKITAITEGLSYLVLLFNMLVIKRISLEFGQQLVYPIGMAHGLLFLGYILLSIIIKDNMKWSGKDFFIILISSIIPFATFWIDRKYLTFKYVKTS